MKKETFNKKNNDTEDLTQNPVVEEFIADILSKTENLPEEKQEEIIFNNFKEIGINVKKNPTGEWEVIKKTVSIENKISPEVKEIEKKEKEGENYEKFIQTFINDLVKEVEHLPEEKKEKEIIKILNKKYNLGIESLESGDLAVSGIVEKEIIPDEKTIKDILSIKENDENELVIFSEILPEIKGENKQKAKNYLIGLVARYNLGFKIPEKAIRWAKKTTIILGIVGAGLATAFGVIESIPKNSEKKEISKDKNKKELLGAAKYAERTPERLSENCKEAVKYFKENDPTPGMWFIVTEKDSAKDFVFDEKYQLQRVEKIGLGKTLGEDKNTSYQLHQGKTTSPAGVYIMIKEVLPINKKIYASSRVPGGTAGIGLYGISVKGDKIVLGRHLYYPDEAEKRRIEINNPNEKERPKTARVSDGCINTSEESIDFILKHFTIRNNIMGLNVILPDSGKPIDLDKIMPEIKKTMEKLKKIPKLTK